MKHLDEEVLALMDEAEVLADMEEADTYTQRIYQQLVRIDTHFNSVASAATGEWLTGVKKSFCKSAFLLVLPPFCNLKIS